MDVTFDPTARRLGLGLADRAAARTFFAEARRDGGFLVTLADETRFRERLLVVVTTGDGFELDFSGEVSGVSPTSAGGFATAILLTSWGLAEDERLQAALAGSGAPGTESPLQSQSRAGAPPSESEPGEGSAAAGSEPEPAVPQGETRGVSPMHRIRAMNPNQRAMLARKADRVERQILLKDTSPQVLQALLNNPRIEGKDVLRLVQSTHTAAPVLKRVADDPRWGKSQEILAVIAKNPKTPAPQAIRMTDKLRTSDLRWMAKMSSGVRENIRRAALREYLRRTGR
jgi:hypothetical protein